MNGKVLLAHQKGAGNTFLPGGHIGIGEKAELALIREIDEEIGKNSVVKRFIGAVESTWIEHEQGNHEVNLLFEVQIAGLDSNMPLVSRESHLEFMWVEPEGLKAHNLLPNPLIDCLVNWSNGYHAYWGSSMN